VININKNKQLLEYQGLIKYWHGGCLYIANLYDAQRNRHLY